MRVNTVFRLKRKFAFHTYVSKTMRHLVYQYLHMTCFCYENTCSLCINIGMSHVCVMKTLHCLNQRIKIPSETMRACYENLFSLCINMIISHLCVTKTPQCWWESRACANVRYVCRMKTLHIRPSSHLIG